jgi:hypothetical protein
MDNNTTITNTSDRQNGDTTITVEDIIDGNVAYSSVRYTDSGVMHTTAINGVVVSSGPGHPATGPLTETGIQSGIYWRRNIVSRFYH